MPAKPFGIVCVTLVASVLTAAEPQLHLKSQRPADSLAAAFKSRSGRRSHLLLRFAQAPRDEQIGELLRRGVNFVRYVPDFGYVVAADNGTSLDDLGLRGIGRLSSEDKLSPLLWESTEAGYVVEFHPDVYPAEAAALLRDNRLEIQQHADLLPGHWLVRGTLKTVSALAEWDEVAYIFPASEELLQGERVIACAGAITALGPIGQYVATVGDGWDGPGRNAAQLGYSFAQLTDKLPQETMRTEILRALEEWTRYVKVSFVPVYSQYSTRSVAFLFARGQHGDPFPFDGAGNVLAHTFYPSPPNSEPLAGDIHLDADENWGIGTDPDLFSVVLHELGHALGLGHSDKPGSVMYPYYRRATALTSEDIVAIRQLYAAQEAAPGTPPPPATPLTPPPVPPPPANGPDTVAPSLTIVYPASTNVLTSAASIAFRGTATDNVGVTEVTWTAPGGRSGAASGTAYWNTPEIPLYQGSNAITIRARDAAGNVGWRSVTVTRR